MKEGDFFLYKGIKIKDKKLDSFQYKRIVLKQESDKDKESCTHWKYSSLYPEYPISIQLFSDKIIIIFYSFPPQTNEKKNTGNYINQMTITLPLDDNFLFASRIKMMHKAQNLYFKHKYIVQNTLFFSEYFRKNNYENKTYLFELFLDFLYDFFHNDVFAYSEHYNQVKHNLKQIPIVQYILAKAQFLYYKGKIRNTELYYEVLNRWLSLLEDEDAEKIMFFGDKYFEPVNKEIELISDEIFKQTEKDNYVENLKDRAFSWQVKNFQIWEILKGKKYIKKKKSKQDDKKNDKFKNIKQLFGKYTLSILLIVFLLTAFLFSVLAIAIPDIHCIFLSFITSFIFLILLFVKFDLKKVFQLISFEIFFVAVIIWTSLALSKKAVIIPYKISDFWFYFVLVMATLSLFFIIKKTFRYTSLFNTFLIFIINFMIPFYFGTITLNTNSKDLLTSAVQKQILLQKQILTKNPVKIEPLNMYRFSGDSIKIAGKNYILIDKLSDRINIKRDNQISSHQIYFAINDTILQVLPKDSLLYSYANLLPDNTIIKQLKISDYNIIFLSRYLLFWTIVSAIAGIFAYIWDKSKIKGKL